MNQMWSIKTIVIDCTLCGSSFRFLLLKLFFPHTTIFSIFLLEILLIYFSYLIVVSISERVNTPWNRIFAFYMWSSY